MDALRFDERVVLITGAARGMGLAHARLLAERGACVVIADAGVGLYGEVGDAGVADAAADQLRQEGLRAASYGADLADEAGARGAVRFAIDSFGRLDAIVHNAGMTSGAMPFERDTAERLEQQLAINVRAGFLLAQEAWSGFLAQRFGRLVFIGSTAMYGLPRSTGYATAKAAYIGLSRALAAEGADQGVQVNLVAPAGATRMAENMQPSEFRDWFLRTMRPELVSPLVAWLCHPACKANGQAFVVGGGRIARMLIQETRGLVDEAPTIESLHASRGALLADDAGVPIPTFQAAIDLMMERFDYRPAARPTGFAAAPPPLTEPS